MKYSIRISLKVLLMGGLLAMQSMSTASASEAKAIEKISAEPWYAQYMGLPVADVNGNIIGEAQSIAMNALRTPAAKLEVVLKSNEKSTHEKMFIPLSYVGFFKEEGMMKLLKPVHQIEHSLAVKGAVGDSVHLVFQEFIDSVGNLDWTRWNEEKLKGTILM